MCRTWLDMGADWRMGTLAGEGRCAKGWLVPGSSIVSLAPPRTPSHTVTPPCTFSPNSVNELLF